MLTGTVAYAVAPNPGVTNAEYEVWTQSPSITCGITADDMTIYKALDQNILQLYPLPQVGNNYYLAICTEKITDGGWSGKTKTSYHDFFVLYTTEDSFIIISKSSAGEEYYWDRGFSFADISSKVDASYYKSNGSEKPCYIINPQGKYTNSNYDEYDEYFFITDKGYIYKMSSNAEYGCEGYPYIKDKILYRGQNAYRSGSSTKYYYVGDTTVKASNSTPMIFKTGTLSQGTAVRHTISEMTTANGYDMYTEGFASNMTMPSYYQVPDSDNLFFTMGTTRTLDSTDNTYYYYLKLELYKSNKGNMTKVKTVTVPTKSTSSTFTPQKITDLDANYYISKGLPVPSVTFGHYAVIARDGTVCALQLDKSKYYNYVYPCTYNGRYAVIRSYNGSSTIYKQDPSNGSYYYWQVINEITFDTSGTVTVGADNELRIQSSAHTGQNGYFSGYSTWNASSFSTISSGSVKAWFGRTLTNKFPDGRYVTASWMGVGSGIYELWYNIYNPDGTLRATGASGYSGYFGSVFDTYDLITYAVNNSKFLVCLGDIGNSFLKEYYRYAVVEETDTGEIVSKVEIGEKTITPPSGSDTEVVQDKINLGDSELPLGYNIKDNVIDSGKLDAILRDQVNSVRLNDIVLLTKEGYQSGEQNTGVTLSEYSSYDYSFGSSYIRLYTNGQYFRWYCYNPEELTPGTYSKAFVIGDKTVYVTFKIVDPPTNEGSTTVVF